MTSFPLIHSNIALSPEASASERCPAAFLPPGRSGATRNKGLALQGFDCFGDGCVIIQRILRERADRQLRFSGCCRIAVIGLDKIKHIRRQPGVIDAVYGREIIE